MIIHECIQGSAQWSRLRMGRPTASCFDRILTAGGKPSTQAQGYLRHLIAEMIMRRPLDSPKTSWMERGTEMEGEAAAFYELLNDVELQSVGFCTTDDGTIGASPDRVVQGDEGLVEIKVPAPQTHVGYLLYRDVDKDYRVQLQGQLYVTGRQWVDIISYHPEMPPAVVRVERDEEYIEKLAAALAAFCQCLAAERERLIEQGLIKQQEQVAA